MTIHRIHKGFDLRIKGRPERTLREAAEPVLVGVEPTEFLGIKAKALVGEGDRVRTGQPLFKDKTIEGLVFCASATGKVSKIELGRRRVLQRIEIIPDVEDDFFEGPRIDPQRLEETSREELVAALLGSGLWPLIRQRPLGKIARPHRVPSAIYVNGMDTEPLAADPAFVVRGLGEELQLGLRALRRLTDGPIYLTVRHGAELPPEFERLQGVERHEFAGPHPAGLVGTHISRIAPLRAGEVVWYLKAPELAMIGEWLAKGRYPTHRVVAVGGELAPERAYFRVRQGAALMTLTGGKPLEGDVRLINGTVLTGIATDPGGFLGYYAWTVTIIPEGGSRRELLGWALPQFHKLSASRAVWSWIKPEPEYSVDARLNGGPRHIVNIGAWEAVTPLDILPTFLVRAVQANDLDEALELGLLEVTEEDVALCTFADPCKVDVGEIVRKGLDLYEAEEGL